ncbi:hypothetical protein H0E84_19590 [Luteimonas sp. SJ-92]|uniref:Glycoside hydrolase family 19 catalytic domain-containing protein n=1 Tax=Luteimonas salinisoli TaxID=2752307 RepID=A0A853JGQ1_9GAMM|nr:hypothetical protein [Luteimonas salinisoli]NZA28581.1 hypothetical protein [Luteimonas salinisoli]
MEIEINDTPETSDDHIPLHSDQARPEVPCRIRATSQATGAQAVLSNPDGRVRFPGATQETVSVSLPDDGSWAAFSLSGEIASAAAGDAVIEARCAQGGSPVKAQAAVTVCALSITSETEQTVSPAASAAASDVANDRARTRLGVEEVVALRATGALGDVNWEILEGGGALSAESGAETAYTAPDLERNQNVRIRATDAAGCKKIIEFDVDCNYVVARARIAEIFSTAPQARVNEITDAFNEFYEDFGIDDCLRRAHFFAQVVTEVGAGGNPRRENLNYTPDRLVAIFGYYAAHPADAQAHGRTAAHPADQEAIANNAYANRIGNGNAASGDGWAFRGRGYIQLTGRANYQAIQNEIDGVSPGSGIDIVANPDAAITIRGGMLTAMAFWSRNNINNAADGGTADADINGVSTIINAHGNHAERRQNFRNTAEPAFHVADCPRVAAP